MFIIFLEEHQVFMCMKIPEPQQQDGQSAPKGKGVYKKNRRKNLWMIILFVIIPILLTILGILYF